MKRWRQSFSCTCSFAAAAAAAASSAVPGARLLAVLPAGTMPDSESPRTNVFQDVAVALGASASGKLPTQTMPIPWKPTSQPGLQSESAFLDPA